MVGKRAREVYERIAEPLGLDHTYDVGAAVDLPRPRVDGDMQLPSEWPLAGSGPEFVMVTASGRFGASGPRASRERPQDFALLTSGMHRTVPGVYPG
ncbi:hypothetical protein GCM10029978_096830 [Actinoallomurus acanthiterrae]